MTRRLIALALILLAGAGCAGGHSRADLTPAQRLHAAVTAAQKVYDPDSAGGTGYGTTAVLVDRMGAGTYGTPQPWPDDQAFRPGVVYVSTLNSGREAALSTVDPSRGMLFATAGPPHTKTSFQLDKPSFLKQAGMVVIGPGVLSGDMLRAAFEHNGFRPVTLDVVGGGHLGDGVTELVEGGTPPGAAPGDSASFITFHTAADARRANAFLGKPRHLVSAVVGAALLRYSWTGTSPNRSKAFLKAVAELRQEVRTE